ncbi:MAG: MgtC/SapB family protein [Hyphomonas sp.]
MDTTQTALIIAGDLLAALAIGLLIGLERGWKDRADPTGSRVAGFRTFGLIGLAGGLAATLDAGNGFVISAGAIALALLLREGFEASIDETQNVSATTMVAAVITFALGAVAVKVSPLLAAGGGVVTAFILWLREPMHRLLDRIEQRELSAFLRLLLISVVVLPVMPNVGLGPWQVINPQHIWWMVVLISGLSFIGYLAVKFLGERGGVGLLALAGGLASSTAATLSFARLSRDDTGAYTAFAGGTAAAWAVMVVRTILIVAGIRPSLLPGLALPMAAMFAVAALAGVLTLWLQRRKTPAQLALPNPLDIKAALVFAGLLTAALVVSRAAQEYWGQGGILSVAAIAGTVDTDAITISMSRLQDGPDMDQVAARAIILAVITNTLFKGGLAAVVGGRAYGTRVLLTAALTVSAGLLTMLGAMQTGWL